MLILPKQTDSHEDKINTFSLNIAVQSNMFFSEN